MSDIPHHKHCWTFKERKAAAEAIERLGLENSQIRDRWAKMGQQLTEARAEIERKDAVFDALMIWDKAEAGPETSDAELVLDKAIRNYEALAAPPEDES